MRSIQNCYHHGLIIDALICAHVCKIDFYHPLVAYMWTTLRTPNSGGLGITPVKGAVITPSEIPNFLHKIKLEYYYGRSHIIDKGFLDA